MSDRPAPARRRRLLALSALALAAAGLFLVGGESLVRVWRMKQEVAGREQEIRRLRSEVERLSGSVDRLREDPALIEQLAREELGLVKPGEKVLKFPPEKR